MKKLFLMFALLVLPGAHAQNSVILNAMKDELKRSVEELKLDREAGPYYLSYQVKDIYTLRITADSGAITVNSANHNRTLKADLRVGDYALDNSNFMSLSSQSSIAAMLMPGIPIPIDNDYAVLRRQIWQTTDRAYKTALETLAKKKAALQNTVQTEALPDFTKGDASSSLSPESSISVPAERWTQFVDQLSKLFTGQQKIYRSKVDLKVLVVNSYYANSEGAVGVEPSSATRLSLTAATQADDGMPVGNYLVFTAARPEGLPDRAQLESQVKGMIADLLATRAAPLAQDYSGPVLFEAQAAAELFGQGFGKFLLANRTPVSDSAQFSAMFGRMENPFLGKLNTKVAPAFLSVKAVPALKDFNRKPLLGSYVMDEEGVKCRDVNLIENGILKNLLTTRAPVKGLTESNGHSRGGSAAPGAIQVISSKKITAQDLKQELIKAVKEENLPYGYIVRGLTPVPESMESEELSIESLLMSQQGPPEPTQFRLTKPCSVFRVYPDGKEELIRGAEFSSLSINTFKNIVAASDQEIAYDYPLNAGASSAAGGLLGLLGVSGMAGPDYYATVITPSLLIRGIDLKKASSTFQKPPIVSSPAKQ
jgi:predicted Zn-dependent protease